MPNELSQLNDSLSSDISSFDFSDKQFAIVVSKYNDSITNKLHDAAIATLQQNGVNISNVDAVQVPGAWEIALAAKTLAKSKRYAGIICLGAVIRGETTHDQHINRFVSQAIGQISLEFEIPISFGVLTCNSFEQAHERSGGKSGNKGVEAALAVLEMVGLLQSISRT